MADKIAKSELLASIHEGRAAWAVALVDFDLWAACLEWLRLPPDQRPKAVAP